MGLSASVELAFSGGELFALVESAPDALILVDENGTIVLINGQTERIFKYPRQALIGKPVEILVPGPQRRAHAKHVQGFLRTGSPRPMGATGIQLFGLRSDGTVFPVEVSLSPIETSSGVLIASSVRDVSSRVETERKLRNQEIALARSAAKDRFLATMSHELRTPLNVILGFSGTMLMGIQGSITDGQREQLETIEDSAEYLLALVGQLLDLGQIESGELKVDRDLVDLRNCIERVARMLGPGAERKGLSLAIDLPATPVVCSTDSKRVIQILINLVTNAIKFTDHGQIRVSVREVEERAKHSLEIVVSDTGCGIEPENADRVFELFFRGTTNSHQPGTGIGLYVSKQISKALGGALCLESVVGRGSEFRLCLSSAARDTA